MITLGPSKYKQRAKWILDSKNKHKTISMSPIVNSAADTNVLYNETITDVKITSDDVSLTNDNLSNYGKHRVHWYKAQGSMIDSSEYGKGDTIIGDAYGRVDILVAEIDKQITLSTPIPVNSNVSLELACSGERKETTGMPSEATLADVNYHVESYVDDDITSYSTDLILLNGSSVALNGFVRNPNKLLLYDEPNTNLSSSNEILTRWYIGRTPYKPTVTSPAWNDWADGIPWNGLSWLRNTFDIPGYSYNNYISIKRPERFAQDIEYVSYLGTPYNGLFACNIPLQNFVVFKSIEIIDSTHIRVQIKIPVMVTYACQAHVYRTNQGLVVDGHNHTFKRCFYEKLTGIEINILGNKLDDTVTNTNIFSLNDNNQIVAIDREDSNTNISIDKSELFTSTTYFRKQFIDSQGTIQEEDIPYNEWLAKYILSRTKRAKSLFTCLVDAQYVIDNGLSVGDKVFIKNLQNQVIKRNGSLVSFVLKNINKRMNGTLLQYELGFVESSLSTYSITITFTDNTSIAIDASYSEDLDPDLVSTITNNQVFIDTGKTINDIVELFVISEQVITIGDEAFREATNLTTIDLSLAKCSSIGESAFRQCSNLKTVKLPTQFACTVKQFAFDSDMSIEEFHFGVGCVLTAISIFIRSHITNTYYYGTNSQYLSTTFGSNSDPSRHSDVTYVREGADWVPLTRGATLSIQFNKDVSAEVGFVGQITTYDPNTSHTGPTVDSLTDYVGTKEYSIDNGYPGFEILVDPGINYINTASVIHSENISVSFVTLNNVCVGLRVNCLAVGIGDTASLTFSVLNPE